MKYAFTTENIYLFKSKKTKSQVGLFLHRSNIEKQQNVLCGEDFMNNSIPLCFCYVSCDVIRRFTEKMHQHADLKINL